MISYQPTFYFSILGFHGHIHDLKSFINIAGDLISSQEFHDNASAIHGHKLNKDCKQFPSWQELPHLVALNFSKAYTIDYKVNWLKVKDFIMVGKN